MFTIREDIKPASDPEQDGSWYWLSQSMEGCGIFLDLLNQGIHPESHAMSYTNRDNENIWYLLMQYPQCLQGLRVFEYLINKKIVIPCSEDMAKISKRRGSNTWHTLATNDTELFRILLHHVLPTNKDLSVIDKINHLNTWLALSLSTNGLRTIQDLLNAGIIPHTSDFALATDESSNTNTWNNLTENLAGLLMFQLVLSKGTHPDNSDLAKINKKYNANIWGMLMLNPRGVLVFKILLELGIYPSSKDLSQVNTLNNKDTWTMLVENSDSIHLFVTLINSGTYPTLKHLYSPAGFETFIDLIHSKKDLFDPVDFDQIQTKLASLIPPMIVMSNEYNIDCDNMVASLLVTGVKGENSRWAFLYFFYKMSAGNQPVLPFEILILIGKHIFPISNTRDYRELASRSNRNIFLKYSIMESINFYNKSFSLFKRHDERADSLKKALKINEHPESVLLKQYLMSRKAGSQYYAIAPSQSPQKHQTAYTTELKDEFIIDDEFKFILDESLTLGNHVQQTYEKCSLSKKMTIHLTKEKEIIVNKYLTSLKSLIPVLDNIIALISTSSDDSDAMQQVIDYMLHLPVAHPNKNMTLAFGNLLNLSEPITVFSNIPEQPFQDNNIKYLHDLYEDFMKFYKDIYYLWSFSYPHNLQGEIKTPLLEKWQAGFAISKEDDDPYKAYSDFRRGIDINESSGNQCSIVLLPSVPDENTVAKLLMHSSACCMIRTKSPDALFLVNGLKKHIERILINREELKLLDDILKPDNKIRTLSRDELSMLTHINTNMEDMIIHDSLLMFINQLRDTTERKEIVATWLSKSGGQGINRFVDDSFTEKHFGNEAICMSVPKAKFQSWLIVDNKVVFKYSLDILCIIGVDANIYCKPRGSLFIQATTDPYYIQDHQDEFMPILRVNAEVRLDIEKNYLEQLIVIPKLVKYDVTCFASVTDSGKLLLQSPERNELLMSYLNERNSESTNCLCYF